MSTPRVDAPYRRPGAPHGRLAERHASPELVLRAFHHSRKDAAVPNHSTSPTPSVRLGALIDATRCLHALSEEGEELLARYFGRVPRAGEHLDELPFSKSLRRALRQAFEGKEVVQRTETELDGESRTLVTVLAPMRSREGERCAALWVVDETAREREREFHDLIGAALDATREGVVVSDARARGWPAIWANSGFEHVTGYAPEDALGSSLAFLQGDETDQPGIRRMVDALQNGKATRVTLRNYRKDGTAFWNDVSLTPLYRTPGSTPSHYVAVMRDVTRTLETNEQLLHTSQLDALGQLAGGVAHDFNNLLTAMTMELHMLSELTEGDAEQRECVDALSGVVDRASSLVRRLLVMSRPAEAEPRAVRVEELVHGLIRTLRRLVESHVEIVVVPTAEPLWAYVDPSLIEQVLVNFVVNARDAMPQGGTVTIGTRSVEGEQGQRQGELSVSDTGHGIPEDVQPRVFEPFYTTKGTAGTGLGLATVKRLVEELGGTIAFETELDRGTTFFVRFPQLSDRAARGHSSRRQTSYSALRPNTPGALRLLLLEDQDSLRRALMRPLERAGYEVVPASFPSAARRLLNAGEQIHLLVTDIVMPGEDGIAFAKWAAGERPALRVVFTTGYTDLDVAECGLPPEQYRLLRKPFGMKELLTTLGELVGR